MSLPTIRTLFLALLVSLVWLAPGPAAAADSPRPAVEAFQETLIDVMRNAQALGVRGRFDRLTPAIDSAFHVPLMARVASGAYWKTADSNQQNRLLSAFRRMGGATAATLFDGYDGQVFKTEGLRPGPQETTLVDTRFEATDGSSHAITYVTKKYDGIWKIVDVLVDSDISELSIRRSEYQRTLAKEGVEGLIRLLDGKADELLAR